MKSFGGTNCKGSLLAVVTEEESSLIIQSPDQLSISHVMAFSSLKNVSKRSQRHEHIIITACTLPRNDLFRTKKNLFLIPNIL